MNKKRVVIISIIIVLLFSMVSCTIYFQYDRGLTTHHTSPHGKEIVLRYDFVSRPTVFYKNKIIWKYEGNAFMETVFFEVTWVSENEILLYEEMYDEEYTVVIP